MVNTPNTSRRTVLAALGLGATTGLIGVSPAFAAPASQRARYHMTPPKGWLCDGQRPVRYRGKTHFYYLHSDQNFGDGGWDVATTTDNVTFGGNRVAIPLRPNFPVWTGCTIIDEANTAGFGAGTLIVLATQPTGGVRRQQEQYLYWSKDGVNFTMHPDPVIPNPDGDSAVTTEEIDNAEWFRDPKVVWDGEHSQWVCVIGRRKYMSIYVSRNLKDWTWTSNFDYLAPGSPDLGGMECPDIFQITADDGTSHWILAASMDAYGANLPMTYAYWVGHWDGRRFNTNTLTPQWLDWGWDWYASVTWPSDTDPQRCRYAIGWMNNWKYAARNVPTDVTDGYNGQMSIVREIRLKRQSGGWYSLLSTPIGALNKKLNRVTNLGTQKVTGRKVLRQAGRAYELELDIAWDKATNVGVAVGCSSDDKRHTNIGIFNGKVYVDRGPSDRSGYSFLPYRQAEAPIDPAARLVHLRIFVDTQSVEVFVNAGHNVLSQQVYFTDGDETVQLYSYDGQATFSNIVLRQPS